MPEAQVSYVTECDIKCLIDDLPLKDSFHFHSATTQTVSTEEGEVKILHYPGHYDNLTVEDEEGVVEDFRLRYIATLDDKMQKWIAENPCKVGTVVFGPANRFDTISTPGKSIYMFKYKNLADDAFEATFESNFTII